MTATRTPSSQPRPEAPGAGGDTPSAPRDWAVELDRITFTYRCMGWAIGKNPVRAGYVASRTGWDRATVTIEAPDMIILEARLRDQTELDRLRRRQPFGP